MPLGAGHAVTLGRDPRVADVRFPEAAHEVSKRHATLAWDPAQRVAFLTDLGSTNGTFLASGERLASGAPRALRPGERFYLARTGYAFEVAS